VTTPYLQHPSVLQPGSAPPQPPQDAVTFEGVDGKTAEQRLETNDRTRTDCIHHSHGVDPLDPDIYDVRIESSAVDPGQLHGDHPRWLRATARPDPERPTTRVSALRVTRHRDRPAGLHLR
jgi:hypothetical protein